MAQRVGRGIALLFHDRGTRRWVSGQQHAPAALYPVERPGTHCTGGWVGPRAGLDERIISSSPGFDPGTFQPVAQSLYRLSCRANFYLMYHPKNYLLRLRKTTEITIGLASCRAGGGGGVPEGEKEHLASGPLPLGKKKKE